MSDAVLVAIVGMVGVVISAWLNTRKTRQKVEAVASEFRNNGGSTIRDAVDRIETRLDLVHRSQVATSERLDRHLGECE